MRTPARSKNLFRPSPLATAIACVLTAQGVMAACPTAGTGPLCVINTNTSGTGSLDDAIVFANANCGTVANQVIEFAIPTGPFVIKPPGGYAAFCSVPPAGGVYNLIIDGTTQPGWAANSSSSGFNASLPIVIDGSNSASFTGLSASTFPYGSTLEVRGIEIMNFNYGAGATALQGNVRVFGSSVHNNYRGIDTDGSATARATIGGAGAANRNVIRNHSDVGVFVSYGGYVDIVNNLIGTDDTGTAPAPNFKGVYLQAFESVTITGNVISGNTVDGVYIADYPYTSSVAPPQVSGNKIGQSLGGAPIPNGNNGITLSNVKPATISNNVIANNGQFGIGLVSGFGFTDGVHIFNNSIHSNTKKNIDLEVYGGLLPRLNDSLDTDTGPNLGQNYPVINQVTWSGGNTFINWTLPSEVTSNYQIEFFANAASGTPAGTQSLGLFGPFSTDAAGNFSTVTTLSGQFNNISALATNTSTNDTSEFSTALALTPTPEVTVAPNPLTFASTVVGSSSSPQQITVSSVGTGNYVINAFDTSPSCYGGAICSTGGFVCANTCATGTPYAPSTSCAINVTFSPSVLGTATTTFYICDNATGSPRTVALTGIAVAPPPPTVSPPSFDFGSIAVGGSSTSQTFTVTNPAPTSTSLSAFSITGPFQLVANTCGVTLAPSASCTVDAKFAPTAPGPASGALSATAGSGPVSAALTGTATPPPATTIGPASIDFGNVTVGSTSSAGVFTITNPALVSVSLSSFAVTAPFTLASTTCTSSLAASSSCSASVTYSPVAVGPSTGTISATAGSGSVSAGLVGNGVAVPPPPNVTLLPTNLDFGTVVVGSSSTPTSFTITNPAASAVSLGTLSTTGPFAIVSTTCGATLAATSNCAVDVKFAPITTGLVSGSLVVPASTGTVTAGLQGTGSAAAPITLSPPAFDFGTVLAGASSAPRTFTIGNPGSTTTGISSITVTGPYAIASTTCSSSLGPAATCDANVKFTPATNGPALGTLKVIASAGTATSNLSGTGLLQAVLSMPTGTIELGTTTLGGATVFRVITLTNTGNAALTVNSITTAAPFALTHTCPLNLLPGESCNVNIEHNPTTLGDFTGTLVVNTNAGQRNAPIHVKVQALPEPVIRVSPQSIGFGDRVDASPSQRITITNDGGADAVGLALRFNTPHFTFTTNCGPTLAPQSSCYADAVFRPVGFGAKRDTFSVRSNAAGSPHTVAVSGAGCRPDTGPSQSRGGGSLICTP